MKKPHRVQDYLEHMVQATERAIRYLEPFRTVEAFAQNERIQDAIIRNIEIIGEAARHIQRQHPQFITAHPEVPWLDMSNMRNKMIHNYFDVSLKVVWSTVKKDLPHLKQQADTLLAEYRKQNPPSR
jgi:uncharacterized protein with HEPN domain